MKIKVFFIFSWIMLFYSCGRSSPIQKAKMQFDSEPKDSSFCFLGEGINRGENFDMCPVEVTLDNVNMLYRKYKVCKVNNTDLYMVSPMKIYSSARYFTRLLKFKDKKQVAAITFYGYNIPYVFKQGERYLLGLNSLTTSSGYNTSSFICKTVLVDDFLHVVRTREFRYKEQKDSYYAYAYIDTLIQRKDGYDFRIVNVGFDSEDYYEYKGRLSFDNVVLYSSKRQKFINKNTTTD